MPGLTAECPVDGGASIDTVEPAMILENADHGQCALLVADTARPELVDVGQGYDRLCPIPLELGEKLLRGVDLGTHSRCFGRSGDLREVVLYEIDPGVEVDGRDLLRIRVCHDRQHGR